jgi:transposase
VRRQKNDRNDAEAICTAARQPHIPFVPKKTVEQQARLRVNRAKPNSRPSIPATATL